MWKIILVTWGALNLVEGHFHTQYYVDRCVLCKLCDGGIFAMGHYSCGNYKAIEEAVEPNIFCHCHFVRNWINFI